MFENPRRGRQARNFTTNVPKILVLKSSSEQIFSRKLPLGAPEKYSAARRIFNSLLGVSSGDETLRLMFDILLDTLSIYLQRYEPLVAMQKSRYLTGSR